MYLYNNKVLLIHNYTECLIKNGAKQLKILCLKIILLNETCSEKILLVSETDAKVKNSKFIKGYNFLFSCIILQNYKIHLSAKLSVK